MSKSTKYLIAIALLLVAQPLVVFFSGESSATPKAEKYFFGGGFGRYKSFFLFVLDQDTVKLEQTGEGWMLNNQYPADEGFVNTLISVLERGRGRKKPLMNGTEMFLGSAEVEFDFNSRYRFQFATNPTKTKTYFISEGDAKEVAVPGYRDNVADIFALHPDQWRDRLIIDGSWRTIQKLNVEKKNDDFEIKFDDTFFSCRWPGTFG